MQLREESVQRGTQNGEESEPGTVRRGGGGGGGQCRRTCLCLERGGCL